MLSRPISSSLVLALTAVLPCRSHAQTADPRCDSIIAASHVDSVASALYISVDRTDGGALPTQQHHQLVTAIASTFLPPKPFRLSVFSGPAVTRSLRILGADTMPELRAPTLTGVYRVSSDAHGKLGEILVLRASLMPGFDSAAVQAIREAGRIESVFGSPEDSMHAEVRFSTDSVGGARRISEAFFPRVPVVDAKPLATNPPAVFPESERIAGVTSGEIVVRFVVSRTGEPMPETIEIVRGTLVGFARAALEVFAKQRFTPATVHGCRVAQRVDYPFAFVMPEDTTRPPRH